MRRLAATLGLLLFCSFAAVSGGRVEGLVCSLTNKKIDKCCCEQKDGKLYCPLAKKAIEKCCCKSSSK